MTTASPRESKAGDLGSGNREGSKLAALTARRIEDEIIARRWPIGEVIGSEADLMARYEVSRAVLREAVRLVEHHGAARMRRGPSGGLVVQAPSRPTPRSTICCTPAASSSQWLPRWRPNGSTRSGSSA
jgi:DNA-binding FadR family transcriptional regulator